MCSELDLDLMAASKTARVCGPRPSHGPSWWCSLWIASTMTRRPISSSCAPEPAWASCRCAAQASPASRPRWRAVATIDSMWNRSGAASRTAERLQKSNYPASLCAHGCAFCPNNLIQFSTYICDGLSVRRCGNLDRRCCIGASAPRASYRSAQWLDGARSLYGDGWRRTHVALRSPSTVCRDGRALGPTPAAR